MNEAGPNKGLRPATKAAGRTAKMMSKTKALHHVAKPTARPSSSFTILGGNDVASTFVNNASRHIGSVDVVGRVIDTSVATKPPCEQGIDNANSGGALRDSVPPSGNATPSEEAPHSANIGGTVRDRSDWQSIVAAQQYMQYLSVEATRLHEQEAEGQRLLEEAAKRTRAEEQVRASTQRRKEAALNSAVMRVLATARPMKPVSRLVSVKLLSRVGATSTQHQPAMTGISIRDSSPQKALKPPERQMREWPLASIPTSTTSPSRLAVLAQSRGQLATNVYPAAAVTQALNMTPAAKHVDEYMNADVAPSGDGSTSLPTRRQVQERPTLSRSQVWDQSFMTSELMYPALEFDERTKLLAVEQTMRKDALEPALRSFLARLPMVHELDLPERFAQRGIRTLQQLGQFTGPSTLGYALFLGDTSQLGGRLQAMDATLSMVILSARRTMAMATISSVPLPEDGTVVAAAEMDAKKAQAELEAVFREADEERRVADWSRDVEALRVGMMNELTHFGSRSLEVFNRWDLDNNGLIDMEEFHKALLLMGFDTATRDQSDWIFATIDEVRRTAADRTAFILRAQRAHAC